ncbi:MAG TPA: hypothetical protein VMB50_04560 [Myxococcales bacterium]|nr:hypothetical protein [Myxococcales bacterium]
MRWLLLLGLLAASGCVPWVRHIEYEDYSWGQPRLDLLAPDVGPVLGEPNEVFVVDGSYWTRYRCRWFVSNDEYAWNEVAPGDVPREVLALPRGPYGAWGCSASIHGW